MSTLTEIEDAADSFSNEDKEALLRFLAVRLREERTLPEPRTVSFPPKTRFHAQVMRKLINS